ncbi:MAG: hypothetical protein RLZZ550_754 [Verrucomicrobiota bacterium]|jgi:prepilin-type N-terminal cleavage/methylation domain-containing protein
MNARPRRRAGFTLIELLMVIAIIMILASATFGLYRGVSNTRMKARARGEIQRIIVACETYKKTYEDYPCALAGTNASNASNQTQFRTDLYDQLSGRRVLYRRQLATGGFAVELWPFNSTSLPNGANRKPKPFLSFEDIPVTVVSTRLDAVPADLANIATTLELRDPWGNPYEYRYRVLSSVGVSVQNLTTGGLNPPYGSWLSANFLLVSCGANFAEPATAGDQPDFAEYFDPSTSTTMVRTGMIPTTYFEDTDPAPRRSDNLVNWSN